MGNGTVASDDAADDSVVVRPQFFYRAVLPFIYSGIIIAIIARVIAHRDELHGTLRQGVVEFLIIATGVAGWRLSQLAVVASGDRLVIRNFFVTRRFGRDQVDHFDHRGRREPLVKWDVNVVLVDGRSIRCDVFEPRFVGEDRRRNVERLERWLYGQNSSTSADELAAHRPPDRVLPHRNRPRRNTADR